MIKFIVDHNVGKLVKWLRMIGYNTTFFTGDDDWLIVMAALNEGRIILTRDTRLMNRGVITGGRLKAVLIHSDKPEQQIRQVIDAFDLDTQSGLFSLCLEDNQPLKEIDKEQVRRRIPDHVFQTQDKYAECPQCNGIYWKGTHWEAMLERLEKIRHN